MRRLTGCLLAGVRISGTHTDGLCGEDQFAEDLVDVIGNLREITHNHSSHTRVLEIGSPQWPKRHGDTRRFVSYREFLSGVGEVFYMTSRSDIRRSRRPILARVLLLYL